MDKGPIFYVYMISRPCGRPCYVGKGHGRRWKDHGRKSHNRHLARIYAKYGDLPISKIREGLTENEAFDFERHLIATIGRHKNGGPLVNQTDGGEGTAGFVHSEEARKIFSQNAKGNKYSVGRKASPETKALQRLAKLGKPQSEEARRKRSEATKGIKKPEGFGAKVSAGKTGKKWSEERKAILRAANRSRDPEVIEKIRAGLLAYNAKRRGGMFMKINRALNLVMPIQQGETKVYVHSTPIGREVFERYFVVIGKAFSALMGMDGIGITVAPRVAALTLKKVSQELGVWEGAEGVEAGLMGEIRRLTNVLTLGASGWEMTPLADAIARGMFDAEDGDEIENAIVFFTLGSAIWHRNDRR